MTWVQGDKVLVMEHRQGLVRCGELVQVMGDMKGQEMGDMTGQEMGDMKGQEMGDTLGQVIGFPGLGWPLAPFAAAARDPLASCPWITGSEYLTILSGLLGSVALLIAAWKV